MKDKNIKITNNFNENLTNIRTILMVNKSFDIIERVVKIYDKEAHLFFIDGLVKDDLQYLIRSLYFVNSNDKNKIDTPTNLIQKVLPAIEIGEEDDVNNLISAVLCGQTAMIVDGFNKAIIMDFRTYPARGPQEPDKEKALRGARDGFVETIVFNTALIRRRIRDPKLIFEMTSIGSVSKTDVAIGYIKDEVDEKALDLIKEELKKINLKALTVGEQSLIEGMTSKSWLNPFPKVRYTERPDVASAHILEGKIVLLVDNNPSAIMIPTCIFDFLQDVNDYYFPVLTGNYLRIIRNLTVLATLLLTPLYLLIVEYSWILPNKLLFLLPKEPNSIPLALQFLILEFAVDGLKLASLNTPSSLGSSLSIIGGLILGEYTVKTGWLIPETILYMAIVALSGFAQPSIELTYAVKFQRIILLILTGMFNIWGFVIGVIINILILGSTKTLTGTSYLYPLIPFNGNDLKHLLFRTKIKNKQ